MTFEQIRCSKLARRLGGWRTGSLLLRALALSLVLSGTVSGAQFSEIATSQYPVPADMSGVHFYLITVDVGDSVWDNFGHTALRVYDENSNSDLVYNWGVFDVNDSIAVFAFNFLRGVLNYRLAISSPAIEFDLYRSQQRTVWQDRINLTNPQKEILYRRLAWNAEANNRGYAYHYHYDNCTTRVRDYLNEAMDGMVETSFSGKTSETFRDKIRNHYASTPLIGFSLDVLMNSNIDTLISEWESLYLPLTLRSTLSMLESDVAEDGGRLPLLSDSQVIVEFPAPTVATDPFHIASVGLLAPVLLLFLMLKRTPVNSFASRSRIGIKQESFSFRLLGLLGLTTSLFSGVYGILMLVSWFISGHVDTHHNVNLLLFWPTDLLGIVIALQWLFLCKPWPMTHNSTPFIHYYFLAHVLAMMVYAVIVLLELVTQELSMILTYVVPGFFLFTILIWIAGFQPARPRDMVF